MRFTLLTILLIFIFSSNVVLADDDIDRELISEVKTAFIYNFLKFISWPENNEGIDSKTDDNSITLLVVGDSLLATHLEEFIDDYDEDNNKINIKYSSTLDRFSNFDVIYIGAGGCTDSTEDNITFLQGKGILTISDCDKFVSYGGIIELFLVESRLRFNINKSVAEKEGLTISSRLLKLAENVE